MNQSKGKDFEKDFEQSASKVEGCYCRRLKDVSPMQLKEGAKVSKNPYDFILFRSPTFYALELKSTQGTSFSFRKEKGNPQISKHQIEELQKASWTKGIQAGFIFNFRKTDHTYFVHIMDFIEFTDKTSKNSINEKDCQTIGVLIPQQKKITRYNYDVSALFNAV